MEGPPLVERLRLPGKDLFAQIEQFLLEGRQVCLIVTGTSMWPLIRHGHDSVRLGSLHRLPCRGDLLLLKSPEPHNRYILHRVYRVSADAVITLGDSRVQPDPPVPLNCVIGRVEAVIRNGREYSCDGPLLRAYAWFWALALPARRPLLRLLLAAGKALRKLGLR